MLPLKSFITCAVFLLLTACATPAITQNITTSANTNQVRDAESVAPAVELKTNQPDALADTESGDYHVVTRVVDGDTIVIDTGEKVRYIGMDTPETVDPGKPVQCFGKEASDKNKALVEGKKIRLEKDVSETDRYGRLLRYVYVGDTFVNLELVNQGYAYAYTYPPDVKNSDLFVAAQKEARENSRGLWSDCQTTATSSNTNTSVPIVSPVINTNTNINSNKNTTPATSCVIKGNISSSGEKIYHVPGCSSYNATVITESKGERWFCTEAEALSAGWRKAKNCP